MSTQPTAAPVRFPTSLSRYDPQNDQQFRRAVEQTITSLAQSANAPPMVAGIVGQLNSVVPTSHTDPRGAVGDIVTDGTYAYFKVSASLWGRVALTLTF